LFLGDEVVSVLMEVLDMMVMGHILYFLDYFIMGYIIMIMIMMIVIIIII
jgi:hypothetical protein